MVGNRTPPDPGSAQSFWLLHLWLPAILFVAATGAIRAFDLDRRIASAWFFDASSQTWIGAGSWWAVDLLHAGGTAFVVTVGLAGLAVAVGSRWAPCLRRHLRKAAYLVFSMVLLALVVGLLKQLTDMDCPRDILGLGGSNPYLRLFQHRPDSLPRAACFPGSHASTGFSLMAFYFMLLDTRPRLARILLAVAFALGAAFSVGQQARGSHFLSDDLTSAALDWFQLLALWNLLLRSHAVDRSRLISPRPDVQPSDTSALRHQGHDRRKAAGSPHARGRRAGIRGVFQRLFRPRLSLRLAAPERRRGSGP